MLQRRIFAGDARFVFFFWKAASARVFFRCPRWFGFSGSVPFLDISQVRGASAGGASGHAIIVIYSLAHPPLDGIMAICLGTVSAKCLGTHT